MDVDVVGGDDTTQTAYQLATFGDYSQAGDCGFIADAIGSTVIFRANKPNTTSTGTYSVAGTDIVGSFAQTIAGTNPTQTFIPQSSFNADRLDGSGPSGMTLDPTKGNVSINLGAIYPLTKVTITDINGKKINSNTYKNTSELNFELDQPNGIYFLVISSANKKAVIRVIKE